MSDLTPPAAPAAGQDPGAVTSAGALLRAARENRGLELDQLGLLLKVPVRKLEALEADRYEELPGLAFVRGLATSMARQLEIDPAPVLAALPSATQPPAKLEAVTRGLATPYREPGGRGLPSPGAWLRPAVIAPLLLLLLALLFWLAPPLRSWLPDGVASAASAVQASLPASQAQGELLPPQSADGADSGGAVAAASAPSAVIETVHSAPPEVLAPLPVATSASGAASAAAAGGYRRVVVLRTTAESWIEARDAAGSILLSRMLPAGETIGLDGELPIRLRIGNVDGTQVFLRGAAYDLMPHTRDNVARVELK